MPAADVVVVGGGIAGASAAYELSERGLRVVLVEREPQLAHHTTGRSAAVFLESYGPPQVRALSRASRPRYAEATDRFGTAALLTPRQALWLAAPHETEVLAGMLRELPGLRPVTAAEAADLVPVLRPETVAAAALEPDAAAIDVLGLHQGYVRAARALGMELHAAWPVVAVERHGTGFRVRAGTGTVIDTAAVVVAAGAWSDEVAAMAGARRLGLRPLRRTIAVCPTRAVVDPEGPLVSDCTDGYYWKVEGPNILCSPADETPSDPCDARPDELDVALAIERVNATTTLGLRSVLTAWAGLRTFSPDRTPVVGEDPEVPGLWWTAGQGGYGIQTAPAMGALVASLVCGAGVPADLAVAGVSAEALSPARFAP